MPQWHRFSQIEFQRIWSLAQRRVVQTENDGLGLLKDVWCLVARSSVQSRTWKVPHPSITPAESFVFLFQIRT